MTDECALYAANSRVLTDGSRVAPAAKYRVQPIPRTRTNPTRDPCGCVGWVSAIFVS